MVAIILAPIVLFLLQEEKVDVIVLKTLLKALKILHQKEFKKLLLQA